jgi:opacity protein-like surface antigen
MKRTVAAIAALLVCSVASAQELRPGVEALQAGGGVSDFTGAAASALTKLGVEWDLKLRLHFNLPISVEVGYVGQTHPTNDVGGPLMGNASILANGLESLARYSFRLRVPWASPFVFGGFGWDHWSLSGGSQANPAAVQGSNNTAVFPWGGGVDFAVAQHWDLDGRFTYRTTILDELITTNAAGQPNAGAKSLTTWALTARVGYVF